ncbi:MAG: 3-deoxy-D-manno-octulosonic acid transferase [Pseudomonadota bacterium]
MYSVSLAIYKAMSGWLTGFARQTLERRLKAGKEDPERIGERRGDASIRRPTGPLVWFHAASVGESLSLMELIAMLVEERPEITVLMTTGTRSSAELMEQRLPDQCIHQFVPVDAAPFVKSFLAHWSPDMAIWTESELWPNLIEMTGATGIPMVLLNARMSQSSHDRWRWLPNFAGTLLRRFDHILVQDEKTAFFLRRLGADPERVNVNGSLKQTTRALPCDEDERQHLARLFDNRPVWLAASTHDPEELIAAQAHRIARRSAPRLLLIVAPRHPERGPAIAQSLRQEGWTVALRSEGEEPELNSDIYVTDTLGEMGLWYRLAPTSFIGGSIAPIGGHNPFEPAALGSSILHGPNIDSAREFYERLQEAGGAVCVRDANQLAAKVGELQMPHKAAEMAHAAWEVSSTGSEATDKALHLLVELLDATGKT